MSAPHVTPSALDKLYNCGEGDAAQRMSAVLWQMNHAATPVTRQVCRQIVAEKLAGPMTPLTGKSEGRR